MFNDNVLIYDNTYKRMVVTGNTVHIAVLWRRRRQLVWMLGYLRSTNSCATFGEVFNRKGKPITSIQEVFEAACRRAEIEGFVHALRHTAINNWRLQKHNYFHIMVATGHKTLSVIKRYKTVSQDELKALIGKSGDDIPRYIHQGFFSEPNLRITI